MKKAHGGVGGVTLTELLVVMVIMGVLASILLPALSRARFEARKASCMLQLKQIGVALKTYEVDNGEYPPWLSNLCPNYLTTEHIPGAKKRLLVCPNDYANPPGSEGRLSKTIHGIDRFEELNDCEFGETGSDPVYVGKGRWTPDQPKVSPVQVRNRMVRYNSYSYEFAIPSCSYWRGDNYPDKLGNNDGVVSWREVKTIVERDGYIDARGNRDARQALDGRVPIVRCFWHLPAGSTILLRSDPRMIVLNLRCGDFSVNKSDATIDGWKKED